MALVYPKPERPEESVWIPEAGAAGEGSASEPALEENPGIPSVEETLTRPGSGASPGPNQAPLSQSDERTWAMLAHLTVLVNLFTGFLGPIAALIIYLFFRDRSRFVAYHAMQSFVFQLVWWVGAVALIAIMWTITGLLSVIIIGLLCIPFAILGTLVLGAMPLVALIYGVIGAIDVNQGRPFKYWLTGNWVNDSLQPQ